MGNPEMHKRERGLFRSGPIALAVGSFLVCLVLKTVPLIVWGQRADATIEAVEAQRPGKLKSTTDYVVCYQFTLANAKKYAGTQSGFLREPREGSQIYGRQQLLAGVD